MQRHACKLEALKDDRKGSTASASMTSGACVLSGRQAGRVRGFPLLFHRRKTVILVQFILQKQKPSEEGFIIFKCLTVALLRQQVKDIALLRVVHGLHLQRDLLLKLGLRQVGGGAGVVGVADLAGACGQAQ